MPLSEPFPQPGIVEAAVFSPDGKSILTGVDAGTAQIWDVATRVLVGTPVTHYGCVSSVGFNRDGTAILTGCEDGTARIFASEWGASLFRRSSITPGCLPLRSLPTVSLSSRGATGRRGMGHRHRNAAWKAASTTPAAFSEAGAEAMDHGHEFQARSRKPYSGGRGRAVAYQARAAA